MIAGGLGSRASAQASEDDGEARLRLGRVPVVKDLQEEPRGKSTNVMGYVRVEAGSFPQTGKAANRQHTAKIHASNNPQGDLKRAEALVGTAAARRDGYVVVPRVRVGDVRAFHLAVEVEWHLRQARVRVKRAHGGWPTARRRAKRVQRKQWRALEVAGGECM